MDGKSVTDTTSKQYQIISNSTVVDGLYCYNERVGIAISSYYGNVGDVLKITLSSDIVFECVIMDIKQSIHVDNNQVDLINKSIIEFVVDVDTLNETSRRTGSLNNIYEGSILKIERYAG